MKRRILIILNKFETAMKTFCLSLLQKKEGLRESIRLIAENISSQGVIYSEIRFAPQLHQDKRKFKSDDIRKKIKSRFHKTLKNIINANLKKAGSKKFFDFLPQCFIGNISKKVNSECLELTYKELFIEMNGNYYFLTKA